jgi:TonB-linked SusC/RagA family outer membrane protein
MNLNLHFGYGRNRHALYKPLLVMKMIVTILTLSIMHVSASSFAQKITLNVTNAPLGQIINEIRAQSGYDFLYSNRLLKIANPVTINVKDASIEAVLDICFSNQPLSYKVEDKAVLIKEKIIEHKETVIDNETIITGIVVNNDSQPLQSATITDKRTGKRSVTNTKGVFYLSVAEGDVITVKYVGYLTQDVTITKKAFAQAKLKPLEPALTVNLSPSTSSLDQVQVTAYGTTSKRLNAGDITTITAKDIERNPVTNVLEALQGQVPGLFIQQVTGQPGSAIKVSVREATNYNLGTATPLVIVDGVRYPASTLNLSSSSNGTINFLEGGNGLNYLNPNDIESVNVLKDIDATAIYGSSGAYGVIIITTKKAKQGDASLSANVYTGVSVNGETEKLLNTQQYLMLRTEAIKNDGLTVGASDLDLNGTWPTTRDNNWQKIFLGDYAVTNNADLSYSGGNNNSSYLISGSLRQNGDIQRHKGTDDDGSLRFSLDTHTSDNKFSISLSGTYLSSTDDMVPYDFSSSALLPPNAPSPYFPNGQVDWAAIGTNVNSSGAAANINRLYNNVTNNLLANATLVYHPIKQLTLRTIFGYNDLSGKELIGYPTTTFNPANTQAAAQSNGVFNHYENRSLTISPYAEYDTNLGRKGDLSVKLGGEVDNSLNYYDQISGTGFPSDALLSDPAAASTVVTNYNSTAYRYIGTFGILKYVWDNKYILDINTRRDGSTKFGPGSRFGNFGSVAGAWIFSEESLVKDNVPFLSFGKIRVSTGVVGGDNISPFQYLSTYSVLSGTYGSKAGLTTNSLANPYLQWERDKASEVGLELGFLHDRIYAEADYYYNKASNQLVSQPLSTVTGFSSYVLNSDAVISTFGWEMNLRSTNIKTKNFSWTTNFNITLPGSKLIKGPSQTNQNPNFVIGKPVTGILLYKYDGVNPATGYYSFTNAAGVKSDYQSGLTQADKTQFVDLAPKFYGAMQNSFSYKQLSIDFSINFTDRMGQNALGQTGIPFGLFGLNGSTLWLQRWQKPGDVTSVPRVSTNIFGLFRQQLFQSSTGAYTNATYARLQNVSIRYHFKSEFLTKMHLKNLSVYLQGQNLLTVSKFGGLDPENLTAGIIPPLRIFTAGFNITL